MNSARSLLPLSLVTISLAVAAFWRITVASAREEHTGYTQACCIFWVALSIEAFSQPLYVLAIYRGHVVLESGIEVLARAADALAFFGSVVIPAVCFQLSLAWKCRPARYLTSIVAVERVSIEVHLTRGTYV